jgi:hypothetical protein
MTAAPIYVFIPNGRIVAIEEAHADVIRKYVRLHRLPAPQEDRDASMAVVQDIFHEHALHVVVASKRRRVAAWRDAKRWWVKHDRPSMFWVGFGRIDQRVTTTQGRSTWASCRTCAAEAQEIAKEKREAHRALNPRTRTKVPLEAHPTLEDIGDWRLW